MRDRLDQVWSQLSYYVDEVAIRVGLARDDPAVDLRRRGIVAIVVCVIVAVCGGWWYTTHVLVTWQPESTHTPPEATPPAQSAPVSSPSLDETRSAAAAPEAPTVTTDTDCDPNYSPCIPNVSGDLNCRDIGYQTVRVVGVDRYELDGDDDGYGCDS